MSEPNEQSGSAEDRALDVRIAAALASRPLPRMPHGFAARVARAAVAQPLQQTRVPLRWGPRLAIVGAVLLFALMIMFAVSGMHTAHGQPWVQAGTQTLCLAEFVAAVYAAMRLRQVWR